jgi:hypothetical protein
MYASPSDNYWIVGDQPPDVRWSSVAVAYIADSDGTYVAWLAAGYEPSIIATEQELADLLNATYPAGSPIPIVPVYPTPGGNGPIYLNIITATPTVMALDDFTFNEKSPVELVPRTAEFRDGLLDKEAFEKEVPGGVAPFSALSGNITAPAGVYRLVLTAQAAGGGGGGIGATAGPGSGGAGGPGETRKIIVDVTPGDLIAYTIGAEGTGGVNNSNGTTGADLVLGAAATVYPVVAASAVTTEAVATITGNINLPAGIVANNLLVMFVAVTHATTVAAITTPAGWTMLRSSGIGAVSRDGIYWKLATGSEGASVAVTTSFATTREAIVVRISGNDPSGTPIQFSAISDGGIPSGKPNPPGLTPSWGSKSTLWIAAAAVNVSNTLTGMPSNFENPIGTATGNGVRIATRKSNSTSMNPTEFTSGSGAVSWNCTTIGILPVTPASIMVCKGGTFGTGVAGATIGACGTTPTGSGGIRIDPVMVASNSSYVSTGGSSLFGACPVRPIVAGSPGGATGSGYGSGGGGACHSNAVAASGGPGAPGMILVEGYGLDATTGSA